jgi:AMP-polyphosphate phosphotransferase
VSGRLDAVDLTLSMSREASESRLQALQQRLLELNLVSAGLLGSGELGPPLCVMFEGWDASGKGGSIKRLVAPLDPRHVTVAEFGVPSDEQKRHHFLWRFVPYLPGWGEMSVFDRSWYGRVLVERVEGLADQQQWRRAYGEISDFEKVLVDEGALLVKFWLHISSDEQLRRFERRRDDPLRRWKLTDDDWRNRSKRGAYVEAAEQMFERTDSKHAPWDIVAAESKHYARVVVLETVIARTEQSLRRAGREIPHLKTEETAPPNTP